VAPHFIDWNGYRTDFEREASAILGRKVTVEGDVSVTILPFPSVTFADITVGEGPVPVVTVEEFSMDAELAPLLGGEFVIFDMRVVRPRANLAIDAGGRLELALDPSGPLDAANVKLEKLTIVEGRVTFRQGTEGGRDHELTEINADISARSLRGPWRVDGALRLDGARMDVGLSTGTVGANGTMRLRLTAAPAIYPFKLESDGDVSLDAGKPRFAGTFRLVENVERTAELRGGDGETATTGALPPPAYRVTGVFALDPARLDISEYRLETGPLDDPYTADGKAYVVLGDAPRFAIEADGAQIRFDQALDVGGEGSGLTLKDRVTAIHNALIDFPRPTIPGTIDIDLPAVVAGDTTIRDVKMSAEPIETGWQIKTLSSTLPGRATLEGSGLLRTGENDFGFSGSMLLAIGQPSGFAAWLSKDVDDAIRRLPAAGFKAAVEMTPTSQTFKDVELILGSAKFNGQLSTTQLPDKRPTLNLALQGAALDVDGMAAFASLFISDDGAERFADRDIDIAVKAGPVTASGLTADSLDTSMRFRDGTLEVDKFLIAGLDGASVSATGSIRDLAKAPSGRVDASILSTDLAPVFTALGAQHPENAVLAGINRRLASYPGLLEDTQLDLMFTAVRNADQTSGLALSAKGIAGGTNLTLTGSATGAIEKPLDTAFNMTLSADGPDAGAIMALYGLRALQLGTVGRGQTTLTAEGSLREGLATTIDLQGEDMQAQFDGFVSSRDGDVSGRGTVHLEAADLEPWLMTWGIKLPGMGLGLPVSLNGYADVNATTLALSAIEGEVADGPLAGELTVRLKDGLPHVTGSLSADALDVAQVAAFVLGDAALDYQSGYMSDAPFDAGLVPPVTAEVDLAALSLALGPIGVVDAARATVRIEKDGLKLADLAGTLDGGALSGLLEIRNSGGNALFATQLKLEGADISSLLDGAAMTGKADISASLTASGKSAGGLIASLAGSGTATLAEISVPGINPDALPDLIVASDAAGREIKPEQTAAFAAPILADGTFKAAGGDIAFTVAAGVLRAPPITLTHPKATLTSELRFDANTTSVAAHGEVTFVAGTEALIGSEPTVDYTYSGTLGNATLAFNTEGLTQFLTQRALEKEQERVESQQAALLEKQRLRREVRYYAILKDKRAKEAELLMQQEELRGAEEAKARAEAEERAKAEETVRLAAEEEARKAEEAEAARIAEELAERRRQEVAQRTAEETARLKAEEEARLAAEEAARVKAEEEARLAAEAERIRVEEAARLKAVEDARLAAEEEARLKAEEEARIAAEAEAARLVAEEAARLAAEEQARLKAEEEARLLAEEEARKAAEATAARQKAEDERRIAAEAEIARLKAEEAARKAEQARLQAEEEARLKAEEEARLKAEEEARKIAEAVRLKAEEEARIAAEAEAARQRAIHQARMKSLRETRLASELERARLQGIEEARLRAEEEAQRILEIRAAAEADAARLKAEVEANIKAEAEAQERAREERRIAAEAEITRLKAEAEARKIAESEAARSVPNRRRVGVQTGPAPLDTTAPVEEIGVDGAAPAEENNGPLGLGILRRLRGETAETTP
jgi:uncharacterized protein involved in outer membrane biogenesis